MITYISHKQHDKRNKLITIYIFHFEFTNFIYYYTISIFFTTFIKEKSEEGEEQEELVGWIWWGGE